jgi:hypothetical protein
MKVLDDAELARVHGGYSPELFAQMQRAIGSGMTINSTWTGQHGSSDAGWAHYKGHAFDSVGSQDQMWKFYNASVATKPHELIFHQKHILDGKQVAPMGGHDGHVHYGK